ncbi:hypothetical protein [uncultured Methanobrevibacter sp.]|uniref:hypothetical protein n=1 Tax=uncultured Methanobrevibacter sp. TaxID=253161 RepID=UPI002635FAF4
MKLFLEGFMADENKEELEEESGGSDIVVSKSRSIDKEEIKKKSLKLSLEMAVRHIFGIPHTLSGMLLKVYVKIMKKIRENKKE